jgi:hypothetical protein
MTKRPSPAESSKSVAEPTPPTKTGRARSREGLKLVLTPIPRELHKQLKQIALDEDTTLEKVATEAFSAWAASKRKSTQKD